jgi:hypothetical protein
MEPHAFAGRLGWVGNNEQMVRKVRETWKDGETGRRSGSVRCRVRGIPHPAADAAASPSCAGERAATSPL